MSESANLPGLKSPRKWYQSIGPGLITACVVIGPGSILTSSKVGARNGFDLTWIEPTRTPIEAGRRAQTGRQYPYPKGYHRFLG